MATFYIAQTSLGLGNGTSAANAYPISWLLNTVNWNGAAGTVCATATKDTIRDEIHWVGTITTAWDWPYLTSTGAVGLRYFFEPGAKFSAPRWSLEPHYAAFYFESAAYSKNNVEIDFGTDGLIECTAAGTLLTYQTASIGIHARSAQNLTIINPRINNMYVRVSGTEEVTGSTGIFVESYGAAVNGLTVLGGTIHDVENCLAITGGAGSSDFLIDGLHCFNFNWGVSCGISATGATVDNFVVRRVLAHDCDCWDEPAGYDAFHHNCIFLYGEPTATNFISAVIERCRLGPNLGTRATSAIYLSHWTMLGTYVVRNCVLAGSPSNGLLTVGTAAGSVTYSYNNTFLVDSPGNSAIVAGGSYAGTGMTVVSRNNIISGGSYLQVNYAANVTIDSDYNLIYGYTAGFPGPVTWGLTSSVGPILWADWQGTWGQDGHSLIDVNPNLDVNGRLQAGSPGIGVGTNLSGSFTTDYDGVTRVPPWDMGAFKYTGGSNSFLPSGKRFTAYCGAY